MADSFYDPSNDTVKTVYERCREYYSPEDFVVVMNIDTKPLKYMVQRPENVVIDQPSAVTKELYYKADPEIVTLQPGQTRLVPAYEADHMIKALIDKLVLDKRGIAIKEAQRKGTEDEDVQVLLQTMESVNDPATQNRYIKQIFQGKRDFLAAYNDQVNTENKARESVANDLEDLEELDESTGSIVKPVAKAKS